MCSASLHAEGLVVVTDKTAASSDACNYAAYIYQENDLSRSLSPSGPLMCHTGNSSKMFFSFRQLILFFSPREMTYTLKHLLLLRENIIMYQISCEIIRRLWR